MHILPISVWFFCQISCFILSTEHSRTRRALGRGVVVVIRAAAAAAAADTWAFFGVQQITIRFDWSHIETDSSTDSSAQGTKGVSCSTAPLSNRAAWHCESLHNNRASSLYNMLHYYKNVYIVVLNCVCYICIDQVICAAILTESK